MTVRCGAVLPVTYIYVKPYDGVLLAVALEPCDFGVELVVLLLPLCSRSVIPLRLLSVLRCLLLPLLFLLFFFPASPSPQPCPVHPPLILFYL